MLGQDFGVSCHRCIHACKCQIHAELCCALFFQALLRWQCKPDAALVQDVTTRHQRSQAWQPKNIPHQVWAIDKYGALLRTQGKLAQIKRSQQAVYKDMKKELQKSLKDRRRACFVAVDQQEETGHFMHWDPLEGRPDNQSESFMSLRMLPYYIHVTQLTPWLGGPAR